MDWGLGLSHWEAWEPPPPCERCGDTGLVGPPEFPVCCPLCVTAVEE